MADKAQKIVKYWQKKTHPPPSVFRVFWTAPDVGPDGPPAMLEITDLSRKVLFSQIKMSVQGESMLDDELDDPSLDSYKPSSKAATVKADTKSMSLGKRAFLPSAAKNKGKKNKATPRKYLKKA